MTADYRIVGIAVGPHSTVLDVQIGGLVLVTVSGAVLVPAGLAGHACRDDIEAEAREVAARARFGWVA